MRKALFPSSFFALTLLLVGCGMEYSSESSGGFFGPEGSSSSAPAAGGQQGPGAGTLTAGVWDDNLNFKLFEDYVAETALDGAPRLSSSDRQSARDRFTDRTAKTRLDIALVIDTTGSMYDEIEYLRAEFQAIALQIESAFPGADQRWALVAYGDEGDVYVVDATPFTDDVTEFERTLRNQELTGGGDYPEASHRGLQSMNQLAWRSGDVARIAFWVADAPHHVQVEGTITQAMRDASDQDVHIYPVASSGVDELTELSMRSAAQLTGGRYIFLTNDSGVGGDHKEPTIPCYFVTRLSDALQRVVAIEMTGNYREPSEDEIIRTGGDPENGSCALPGEEEAIVF